MSVQAIAADSTSTAANQHGQLTPEQQRRTAAAVRAEAAPGLVGGACFAFLFGVILWAGSRSYSSDMDWRAALLFGGLTLLAVLFIVAAFLRRRRGLQEVRAGLLQRADGHIVWQNGAYRAQVPGHTLNLSAFNLAAGTYTFSFLPGSGRVIAAELVAFDAPAQAQDELRHALAVANHFNLDDFSATFDLLGGQVASAAGAVHKSMRQTYGRNASTYYYYKLDALVWTVTPEAYRALIEGPAYRVYYLPRSKMLLGIEPL